MVGGGDGGSLRTPRYQLSNKILCMKSIELSETYPFKEKEEQGVEIRWRDQIEPPPRLCLSGAPMEEGKVNVVAPCSQLYISSKTLPLIMSLSPRRCALITGGSTGMLSFQS